MKTGDREPPWLIDLASGDTAADLNDVVSWRITAVRDTTNGYVEVFSDAPATVTPDPLQPWKAVASHVWASGETDTAGMLLADVVAVWPSSREQTFPTARILIEDSND